MTAVDAGDTLRDIDVKRCTECGARFAKGAAFCPFDGVALASDTWDPSRDPLTGTIVDDRYEVLEALGEGGMGVVYRVRHVALDRFFAMKVLRHELAMDGELAARFMQEARATAAIKHPCVVAITDFGALASRAPYFVMELLVGETLAARIRARGPMPPSEVIDVARKIADGLEASHAAGVVHRDLKPENVFLVGKAHGREAPAELRIVDFGAAKVVGGSKLTRPGIVFGTPYYMSPEQASGEPVDARADIYSLGVLVYEMLTGSVPFEADTYMGVLTKHMFAAPVRPSERVPSGVELGSLEDIVLKMLAKDPAARYRSMREVEADLLEAAKGRPSSRMAMRAKDVGPVAVPRRSAADRIEASVARAVVEDRRRRGRVVLAGAGALLATVAVGAVALALVVGAKPAARTTAAHAASSVEAAPRASSSSASDAPIAAPASASAPSAALAPPAASAPSAAEPPERPAPSKAPAAAPPRPTATPTATASARRRQEPHTGKTGDDFVDPWLR